jgi:hypothetical protein
MSSLPYGCSRYGTAKQNISRTGQKLKPSVESKRVAQRLPLILSKVQGFLSFLTMDFTIFPVGGIDYSPAPWVRRATIVLEEPELRNATRDQFDRFFRVWYSERPTHAPSLIEVTLVLRPGYTDGAMDLRGINAFLGYYETFVQPSSAKGLHVYMDCYTALVDHTSYQVLEQPLLLFTIAAEPQPFPCVWAPVPPALLV